MHYELVSARSSISPSSSVLRKANRVLLRERLVTVAIRRNVPMSCRLLHFECPLTTLILSFFPSFSFSLASLTTTSVVDELESTDSFCGR